MRNLKRLSIIGIVTVSLLAVIYVLLLQEQEADWQDGVIFSSATAADVQSVTVTNESGTFHFYFDPDDGGYVTDEIPPFIVDIDVFIGFLTNSARLSAIRTIPFDESDSQDWGLENPSAEAEIVFFDGTSLRLYIGNIEPVSGNYFAAVDGFEGVHIIPRMVAEQFLRPKTQIISMHVTPPLVFSSPLSAIRDITFEGGRLDRPVTMQAVMGAAEEVVLAAMSFGTATHIVHGAATYQLDQTYGSYIFGSLFGINAIDIVGFNMTEAQISELGFDNPYMTVDFHMLDRADEPPLLVPLRIVQAEDAHYYITVEGSGVVYLIGREPFMDISFDRLPTRWFLTPFIMTLSAVTVEAEDLYIRLEIDNTDPQNPIITHQDQEVDVELFRSFFRLITSAAHDDSYLGPHTPATDAPLLTITYEYQNPAKVPDILTIHAGGVRRHNVFINGSGEFAIRDSFADSVVQGALNLLAGIQINEMW